MKRKIRNLVLRLATIILLIIIISSCQKLKNGLLTLNIENAIEKGVEKTIGDFADELSYVKLETNDKCIIGNNPKVYAIDNNIIVIAQGKIMLFDRLTGKFIHDIGSKGNGPEEYSSPSYPFPVNYDKKTVFANRNQEIIEYDFSGRSIQHVSIPQSISNSIILDDDHFVSFFPNYTGDNKTKLTVYNLDGVEAISLPNTQIAPSDGGGFSFWMPHVCYFKNNNNTYFSELFNDTIYTVKPTKITPRFTLGLGQYLPPYEQQNLAKVSSDFPSKFFMMRSIYESSRYIFYTYKFTEKIYTAIFDKTQSTCAIYLNGDSTNDIDGFVSVPLSSINQSDEFVGLINAFDIVDWFKKHDTKSIDKNLQLFKDLTENDNPIVVIAKLKK